MGNALFEYTANLHVHTTFSDGKGRIEEVISIAQDAQLDLLLINDHDTLEGRNLGYEGYHENLLVLIGTEFSGPHNHYLAYGLKNVFDYDWQSPQSIIDGTKAAGGIGFLAHPFEKGSPLTDRTHAFTWDDWSVTGFDGICLWNFSSNWKSRAKTVPRALWRYFVRTKTLEGPEQETLAKWDELGQTRPVSGIGGSDAHAYSYGLGPLRFTFFPYLYLFRAINTHVLLPQELSGDLETDRLLVYRALAKGSCYVANDKLGKIEDFDFWLANDHVRGNDKAGNFKNSEFRGVNDHVRGNDKAGNFKNSEFRGINDHVRRCGQGEETDLQTGDQLCWRIPERALSYLLRDGRIVSEITASDIRFPVTGPGVYRMEILKPTLLFGHRPWIFSNAIYIR